VVKGYEVKVYYTPGGQRRYSTAEIEQFYLSSGFSGKIGIGEHPAVLIIDCINAFTNKQSPLHCNWNQEIGHINNIIHAAHTTDCPVIFSHSYHDETDIGLRIWTKKIKGIETLTIDSSAVKLDPRMITKSTDVHLYSKHVSVYYETELLDVLRKQDCDTLFICGFSTSASVRAVAMETIQYGIRPIVPAEAVGDRDEHVHRNNLSDIERKFADVVPAQEAVRYLHERVRH
jgi:maleamate amidohydrolase